MSIKLEVGKIYKTRGEYYWQRDGSYMGVKDHTLDLIEEINPDEDER